MSPRPRSASGVGDDPAVDAWVAGRPEEQIGTVSLARAIIREADERVSERIKWGVPTFTFRGDIASFTTGRSGVGVMFHRGAEIPGDHPRLAGDTKLVRTMRFADEDELQEGRADITLAVQAWCAWRVAD